MSDDGKQVRIVAGLGRPFSVPREAARSAGRTVGEALTALVDQHIKDPELRSLLAEPGTLAIELFAGTGQEGAEVPLSWTDPWSRVVERIDGEAEQVEVAVARAHSGGAGGAGPKGR